MKPPMLFFTFFLWVLLWTTALAQENQTQKKQKLYIGIEKNRLPYADLDDKQQAHGFLVIAITRLCESINAECEFVVGEFDQLLQDVRIYKLHALLVIDRFILTEVDKLKLTPSLCKIQPVFIQKQKDGSREKPEDFKGTTIGVGEGSLLHLYLLDEYSRYARLKSFPLLESGIFDLVTGRIDMLSTNHVFFSERLQKTPLGQKYTATPLEFVQSGEATLPATSMTLALREQDTELYETLTKAIQANGQLSYCADLLISQKQSEISIPPPPVDFDAPMPKGSEISQSGVVKPATDKLSPKD